MGAGGRRFEGLPGVIDREVAEGLKHAEEVSAGAVLQDEIEVVEALHGDEFGIRVSVRVRIRVCISGPESCNTWPPQDPLGWRRGS